MPAIVPVSPEEYGRVVQTLLQLADHPREVASTSDYERPAVIISDELFELYRKYNELFPTKPSAPTEPEGEGDSK